MQRGGAAQVHNRIQKILIISVVGLLVIVLALTVFLAMKNNRELRTILDASVKSDLMSISIAAREIIDVDKFVSYDSIESIYDDIDDYNHTLNELRSLQEKVGATFIYAIKEIDGEYYFIFDTDPDVSNVHVYMMLKARENKAISEWKDMNGELLEFAKENGLHYAK
jgi:sulfur transfer complex TusBCD TusB component (DsrH family)